MADPKFTLVRVSALPLTENTGVVREAESVNVMDWTVSDAVDTTNTPSDPVIGATDLVTDPLLGWIVVDFENVVDVDSLTSCVPSIN